MSGTRLKRNSNDVDIEQAFAKLKSTVEKEIAAQESNLKYKQQESVHRLIEKSSESRNKAETFYNQHFEPSQAKLRGMKSMLQEAKKHYENIESEIIKIGTMQHDVADLQQFHESQLQQLWRELNTEDIYTTNEKPPLAKRQKHTGKGESKKESKKNQQD